MSDRLPPLTSSAPLAVDRYLKAFAIAGGNLLQAQEVAEAQTFYDPANPNKSSPWRDTTGPALWLKAQVDAMSTGNSAAIATPTAIRNGIIEAASPRPLVDRIVGLRRVPLNTQVPMFTVAATAAAVAEGQAKPLSRFSSALLTVAPRKFVADVVVTSDLLRYSGAESSLAAELGNALTVTMDQSFIDPNIGGSVTNGAATISSTGSSLAAVDADLKSLQSAFESVDGGMDSAIWITAPRSATYLASLRGSGGAPAFPNINLRSGGTLWGVPLFISAGLRAVGSPGETEIVLMDPRRILFGDDGEFEVTSTKEASVQMSDTPSSAAAQQTSLWQANLRSLRAERWAGWARAGDAAVAILDDVTW